MELSISLPLTASVWLKMAHPRATFHVLRDPSLGNLTLRVNNCLKEDSFGANPLSYGTLINLGDQ